MRAILVIAVAVVILPMLGAQDRPIGTLPPGPAPGPTDASWLVNALFVQANMIEGGDVMFLVPIGETDPKKLPPPPSILAKVDGKAVRAFGVDRKPLDIPELNKRLSLRAAAVVVHGQAPDPFFLKALGDRTVVFVVPKKLFDQMVNTARGEPIQSWWAVTNPGANEPALTDDHWIIENDSVRIHVGGKYEGKMAYKISVDDHPRTIDLTPDHGPAKGKTLKGIYELDGNSLSICYVSPKAEEPGRVERPAELGAKGTVTASFRRIMP